MTKADLIGRMAEEAKISKAAAGKALDAFLEGVKEALKQDERVSLVGFGSFSVSTRKARMGRDPRTGKEINIPARRVPKFAPGGSFKETV